MRDRAEANHNFPVFNGSKNGSAKFVTEGEVHNDMPADKRPSRVVPLFKTFIPSVGDAHMPESTEAHDDMRNAIAHLHAIFSTGQDTHCKKIRQRSTFHTASPEKKGG